MESNFREAVLETAARDDVLPVVRELYTDVQRAIEIRRPLCVMSGRCCRFDEFGHRLFVTTLELAAFVRDLRDSHATTLDLDNALRDWDQVNCPFQQGKLCGVHSIRPFGCRIFFCDATAAEWQSEHYQLFHEKLKRLHENLNVPYFYREWRAALRGLKASNPAT